MKRIVCVILFLFISGCDNDMNPAHGDPEFYPTPCERPVETEQQARACVEWQKQRRGLNR